MPLDKVAIVVLQAQRTDRAEHIIDRIGHPLNPMSYRKGHVSVLDRVFYDEAWLALKSLEEMRSLVALAIARQDSVFVLVMPIR
jgi:hypothetical protein